MLMTAAVPLAKNVLLLFEVITLSSRCRNTEKCGPGPGSKSSDITDPGSLKKPDLVSKLIALATDSLLTNLMLLISNVTAVFYSRTLKNTQIGHF